MTEKYKVSAAIVTYNRLDLLQEAVAAVLTQQGGYLQHLIIVNNHSTDGTVEWLDALQDDRVIVKHLAENVGGAGGFNAAVREFGENTNDDAVWLMDDDTIPEPDALKVLAEYARDHPRIGFVNSNVRWQSKYGQPSLMNIVAPRAFFWTEHLLEKQAAIEVVNSTFVSVLIPRSVVEQIGLPQKEYFIWGDDIEYTNRAADVHRGYFLPNSIVVHKSKVNQFPGDLRDEIDLSRLWRYQFEYRNRLLTVRRVGGRSAMVKDAVRIVYRSVLPLFSKGVHYRWKKIGAVLSGTWKGLYFNPKIEYLNNQAPAFVRSINRISEQRRHLIAAGKTEFVHANSDEIETYLVDHFGPDSISKKNI